jgi:Mor family transcriptional regulator
MNAPSRPKYPELLESLRSIVETQLLERRIDAGVAAEVADACVAQLRLDWGGQYLYVPMMSQAQLIERNKAIVARFNGLNAVELCREYGISLSTLKRIIVAARDAPDA